MQPKYLILVASLGLILSGCVTSGKTNVTAPPIPAPQNTNPLIPQPKLPEKNPISVTLYTGKQKPEKPYVILGQETVSKYNLVGIKRQEANIRDAMRHLAATLGGDAVINITNQADAITGTVITYKDSSTNSAIRNKV